MSWKCTGHLRIIEKEGCQLLHTDCGSFQLAHISCTFLHARYFRMVVGSLQSKHRKPGGTTIRVFGAEFLWCAFLHAQNICEVLLSHFEPFFHHVPSQAPNMGLFYFADIQVHGLKPINVGTKFSAECGSITSMGTWSMHLFLLWLWVCFDITHQMVSNTDPAREFRTHCKASCIYNDLGFTSWGNYDHQWSVWIHFFDLRVP